MGYGPDRVMTDGHGSYPRAIRSVLGQAIRHRTSAYLNNRLEQDRRGIKGRIRCMQASRILPPPAASAASTGNAVASSNPDAVTTKLSPPPSTASASQEAPELRSDHAERLTCRVRYAQDQDAGTKADRT